MSLRLITLRAAGIACAVLLLCSARPASGALYKFAARAGLGYNGGPPTPATYESDVPFRFGQEFIRGDAWVYGDGAGGDKWVSSSSWTYTYPPNPPVESRASFGASGFAEFDDELVISTPGLDGTAGRLNAMLGWRTRHYGFSPTDRARPEVRFYIYSLDAQGGLLDQKEFIRDPSVYNQEFVGVIDLDINFVFGAKIGVNITTFLDASGDYMVYPPQQNFPTELTRQGGYAAASWRGIQKVRDSAGTVVPFTSGFGAGGGGASSFAAAGAVPTVAVVSSLSGLDYTVAAPEPEVRVIPEPSSLSLLGVAGFALLARRRHGRCRRCPSAA